MLRKASFIFLLLAYAYAYAAGTEGAVDDVLKAKPSGVTEEQLDETAAKMITEETGLRAPTDLKGLKTASTKRADSDSVQPLSENQIPVLKSEKAAKSVSSSNWFRLIGSAAFVLAITGSLILAVKNSAKRKNVGGKKAKIEILHQHFLGPKKSVALIQVAGEAILIGVTDHSINMIKSVALIDDELIGENPDFNGFLEDEFTVEQLTANKSRTRMI